MQSKLGLLLVCLSKSGGVGSLWVYPFTSMLLDTSFAQRDSSPPTRSWICHSVNPVAYFLPGTAGFIFGGAVGIVKGLPTFLSAAATSLQTFALGAAFTTTRTGIITAWTTPERPLTSNDLTKATAVAGAVSGGFIGAFARGRKNVIPGAIMWSIFGALGQVAYNRWTLAPRAVEKESRQNFWQRMGEKGWTPFTVLSNEEYAKMLEEKMLKVEVEISILDDKIAALEAQQQAEEIEAVKTKGDDG